MAKKPHSQSKGASEQETPRERLRASQADIVGMTKEDAQALVHELQAHHIELELQQEELRRAQLELTRSRDAYRFLYDFAPVGYITVNAQGGILEANLTAATMLGAGQQALLRDNFSKFVARDGQDTWYLHRQAAFSSETQQSCELPIHRADGTPLFVRLESTAFDGEYGLRCHTALIDITERRRTERLLAEAMRQQEALYQFVERRQRAKSLEEIYDSALDAILSALRCERASILLLDDSGVMRFVAWRGLSEGYRKSTEGHSPWKNDEPNPQPVYVSDVAVSDLDDSLKAVVTGEGIGALAFIPLVVSGSLIGKFMIYYNAPHAFDDEELELSLNIAGQLSLAIERLRAEEALRIVSLLPAQNPAPVLRLTRNGTLLYANPAAFESFKEWNLCVGGTVPRELSELVADAWIAGQVRTKEQSVGDRDYLVCIAPVLESDYANLYWNDITERKKNEVALRESEARFRQLADSMPQIVWTARPDGYIDYYNERWYEFTGFPRNEFGQSSWEPILHPDDVQRCVETYFGCVREGKAYQIEYRFKDRARDGYRWFMGRGLPIRDDCGEIHKWVGTCTDIDDQKRGNERLEKIVAERTAELQQANAALLRDMEERKKLEEQLLQAQKMESIGVLAGGIAHDFNNILNIIQGYASVLSADGSQKKQMGESLSIIDENIRRGSALVQQLLTLARKSTSKLESVSINVLVEGIIALITPTFPKTIELSASLEADLPPIMADKNQIEQALLNICVNARDAMPNGGRLIFKTQSVDGATLQALGEKTAERYVCIEVTDTGMGMDESVQERIFDPFFTTKDMGQGTGLGLSVVYGIVKNHNGLIQVESKPDIGTIFQLYFPIFSIAATPITDVGAPASVETRRESGRYGTILLVEDEKDMLHLVEKILLRSGYRVLTANDGEQALEVYQRHNASIDVVLLDIGLPKIAGGDVLRKMRQQNPAVKVAVASGYLDPGVKAEISEAGVQHFVDKPYRLDQVVNTLQCLIEEKS